ncbi:MAG: 3'-5' exonuclease [Anaerolineae bacterium]|nr:3'-5' exonuclease [Anaerolineae bacterium]
MNLHNVPFLVLDTETTGLDDCAEICQIAIVDHTGQVLLDQLVKPTLPIPDEVAALHGITDALVADQPTWQSVRRHVVRLVKGKTVVVYNAEFDLRMMMQSDCMHGLSVLPYRQLADFQCAMRAYANGGRWVKLSRACAAHGIPTCNAHSALGDCLMTLALVRKVWLGS